MHTAALCLIITSPQFIIGGWYQYQFCFHIALLMGPSMAEEVSAAHSGVEPICSSHQLEHGNDGIQEEFMHQLLVDHVLRKGCTCIPYALTLTLLISNILSL